MDIESIDWTTIHTVVKGMTIKQWRWMTKFTTGFCATGQMMYQWGQQGLTECPRCGYETETTAHILQCPNSEAQAIVDQNTQELQDLLKNLDMEPNTMEDLSKGFYAWSANQPP